MFLKPFKLVFLAASCAALSSCSWFEKDTYVVADVPEIENRFEPRVLWKTSVGSGVGKYHSQLTPNVTDEKIFTASRDGMVYCLDKADGKVVWSIDLDDREEADDRRSVRLSGGVAVGFDKVFVASENGYLYALNRNDGSFLWMANPGQEILSSPLSLADKVVVMSAQGQLFAYNDEDGSEIWKTPEEASAFSMRGTSELLSVERGKIILYGTAQGKIAAVESDTGLFINNQIASLPKGMNTVARLSDVDSTPLIVYGEMYMAGYHGSLTKSGSPRDMPWKANISTLRNLAYDYTMIFAVDDQGYVHAVSRSSGNEAWVNRELAHRNVTAPAVIDDYVVVGDEDGYLYWLSTIDGSIQSMDDYDSDGLYIPPVVSDGVAYLQTRDGTLYALTLKEAVVNEIKESDSSGSDVSDDDEDEELRAARERRNKWR